MLSPEAVDQIFLSSRSANGFGPGEVPAELLHRIRNIAKIGPTSFNCSPMRVVFVRSPEGKERLRPTLMGANVDKTMAAPVTALFAYDITFYDQLPVLFPTSRRGTGSRTTPRWPNTRRSRTPRSRLATSSSPRALGLDCGLMAGFSAEAVNAEFIAGTSLRTNLLLPPRLRRRHEAVPARAPSRRG